MRERRLIYLLLTMGISLGLMVGLASVYARAEKTAVSPPRTAIAQATKSDEDGLDFTLTVPSLTTTDQGVVYIAGLTAQVQEPGAPALPYYVTFIALPPEATAAVSVQMLDMTTRRVGQLPSVPQPADHAIEDDELARETAVNPFNAQPPALINLPDPAVYQRDALYPDAVYTLSEPMYYRDLRLVELRLYPARYNPVAGKLLQAGQLNVSIRFDGAQMERVRPSAPPNNANLNALADAILNYEQALNWRSLPADLAAMTTTNFPVNAAETYKIELNQDGIYEISRDELQAAGMNVSGVNPKTIEMMWRGQPVAYQLVNDNGDAAFDANEKIRFYGWAFDGPRTEKQFISNNVFWLWANPANSPTIIQTKTNQTGGAVITATMTAVTREPENYFFSTWTNNWDTFPNEPDAWYWDFIEQNAPTLTKTYPITLPHPVANGPNVTYWIELMSRDYPTDPTNFTYIVRGHINDDPNYGEQSWMSLANVNITNTVPATAVHHGANDVKVVFAADLNASLGNPRIYLNRITVEYMRQLVAKNNQLVFADDTGGSRQFHISGFTEGDAANVLVWDITNPTNPTQIGMGAGNISGDTYMVGSVHVADAKFIATTTTNALSATSISQFAPTSLDPPSGGADWVAVSHADFITQAERLAAHRALESLGGLTTWIVDYEDVVNQYGYGLPLPAAIRDYLAHALANWSSPPDYAVLFGAATLNPRYLDCNHWTCPGGATAWDQNQPTFVVTDLVYEDRYQGLIPSDHTIALLSGSDLLPDIAIGRITADTEADAEAVVSKIILYEQNQLDSVDWRNNLLFVADNADLGGNFYQENLFTAQNYVPSNYGVIQRYLITDDQNETDVLRDAIMDDVNDLGIAILNYRGHGSVHRWASPSIISSDSSDLNYWNNVTKPIVILSADCLDGNFAFPGLAALSKTLLILRDGPLPIGSAAHWSSTGLGFTFEHSVLHQNFYSGLFEHDLTTIGDAINRAKMVYHQGGYDDSEMYSFLLQGDPAMQLFVLRNQNYLPAILK
ncbi:MAG: hypothetical protein GY803_04635 [Chloroflexi bacterium]|nr:hypothetical protein [Chloroflexota bacterium]